MFKKKQANSLAQYEEKAFALYFAHDIHYPYVSVTLMSLVAAWLMHGNVPITSIAIWLGVGGSLNLMRELFVRHMKPLLAQGRGYNAIMQGFALSSVASGATWGAFAWLYFDAQKPLTLLVVGSYLAGHVGGAVTPLSIYLPAFYLFVMPALLPYVWLLVMAGTPEHYALAGLTGLFFLSMANYAHMTNRLHRESMSLRFENQCLIEDLELRKADAESASRTKSLFLAGVSHDLKQPIRAIAIYTGFLRHKITQAHDHKLVVQTAVKIEAAVSAIHGQINRLLELSRLESGNMALNPELLELKDLFAHTQTLFAEQARSKGVRLEFASVPGQRVWVDRGMIESILQNFISNAVKHTDQGAVYVGTRLRQAFPPAQQLCIEVRDSGTGIPENLLPLLFDAYRSFDDRSANESHGLGLAIAKAQASYLGCEIAVASRPGCGSTFTLCGLRVSQA